MGVLAVMGQPGDSKIMWNPQNRDEVKAAEDTWDRLVGKKGYKGFRVKKDGKEGEMITEFDPNAAKLIIAPPMAGGQD